MQFKFTVKLPDGNIFSPHGKPEPGNEVSISVAAKRPHDAALSEGQKLFVESLLLSIS